MNQIEIEKNIQKRIIYIRNVLELKEGDKVALKLSALDETLFFIFALYFLKAKVLLLSSRFPPSVVKGILKELQVKHFIDDDFLENIQNDPFEIEGPSFQIKDLYEKPCETYIFSSGSTGRPKAIRLNFENFYWSARGSIEFYEMNSSHAYLLSLPLFHIGGLMIPWRSFLSGASLIIPKSLSTASLKEAFESHPIRFSSLVPTQLIRLIKEADSSFLKILSKQKCILVGGASCPSWLPLFCQNNKIPMGMTYGMTESCSQVLGSLGPMSPLKVLPYRELMIHPKTTEIMIRGKILHQDHEGEKWFQTGDLGEIMPSSGEIKIKGRKDLMFISGGENIYPQIIEEKIKEIPWVSDALVVPVPDKDWGQSPFAFVQIEKEISSDFIKDFLKQRIPAHFIPKFIHTRFEEKNEKLKWNRKKMEKEAIEILRS